MFKEKVERRQVSVTSIKTTINGNILEKNCNASRLLQSSFTLQSQSILQAFIGRILLEKT